MFLGTGVEEAVKISSTVIPNKNMEFLFDKVAKDRVDFAS